MKWDIPSAQWLLDRLTPREGILDMVLDTDTYNEVDDQFALAYSLLSPQRLNVEAVYAAPFHNSRSSGPGDGMEKSYDEIVRLIAKIGRAPDGFVFKGSRAYLPDEDTPVISDAARDLVARAMARSDDNPLYVVAIGAITNVASALLMEPRIARKIVIVWLGGQPLHAPDAHEFNLSQDIPAARVIFDCGAPVVQVPCSGVASHTLATVPELREYLSGRNPLCDALVELFSAYSDDHFGWAKEIWDVAAIGYMINADWMPTHIEPSPRLSMDGFWSRDARRHPVLVGQGLRRNDIFRDMYRKLANG